MKKRTFFARAALALLAGLMLMSASSGVGESTANPVGFTVKAILTGAQRRDVSYFDLIVAPATEHTIEIEVQNHLSEPLTLEITLNDATSNSNGLISYNEAADEKAEADGFAALADMALETLPVGEGEAILAVQENRIVLAAGASARIPVVITAPDEPIDGQLLGGIVVTRIDEDESEGASAMAVKSVYSYALAVQLQSDAQVDVEPAFSLNAVEASSIAGWPGLTVSIKNEAPLVVTGARMRLRLYAVGEGAPLLDEVRGPISMAPRSVLPYALVLPDGLTLAPGDYRLVVDWTYDDHTREMEAVFSVSE